MVIEDRAPAGRTVRTGLAIVLPVFNDWASLRILIERLQPALATLGPSAHLVIVDDGSTEPECGILAVLEATHQSATLLRLVRNVGHQRAIAIGLAYAVETLAPERIVIMDSDGEDLPEDVPRLLEALRGNPRAIVVAERRRRSEGLGFVLFYQVYKRLFALLTGTSISFGNFSAMGLASARRLVSMHELLLNVPATMIRSRCAILKVPSDRAERLAGRSRMSLIGLIAHGLSAIAVFSETMFTRILVFCLGIFVLSGSAAVVAFVLKLLGMATPGWTTTVAGILMIVLLQNAAIALGGLFVVLNNKRDIELMPSRIASGFIEEAIGLNNPREAEDRA